MKTNCVGKLKDTGVSSSSTSIIKINVGFYKITIYVDSSMCYGFSLSFLAFPAVSFLYFFMCTSLSFLSIFSFSELSNKASFELVDQCAFSLGLDHLKEDG